MTPPNILLLTIDTLRRDRLGCYGHVGQLTPNIDRLAREGLRFQTAITAGSWTQGAFPAIVTATHAATHGGCLGRLSSERPSPVEALARHGYNTAAFSTNPHLSRDTGYDRGFQHFVDLVPQGTDPLLRRIKGGQILLRKPITHRLARALGRRLPLDSNLRWPPAAVYTPADRLTAAAMQWLHAGRRRPFFLWLHYMDVHWPYHLEHELSEPQELALAWQDLGIMHRKSSFKRDGAISSAQQQRFARLYEQALQFLDCQIGRLMDHLQIQQQLQNTIVVLLSDHGEEFFEHGRWGHWESNLYDEIINVPFIMRLPSGPSGVVIEPQVSLLDLMPTLLDLAGCPAPDGVAGQSLVPLWTDEGQYEPVAAVSEMHRPPWHRMAVRTATHKLIWDNKNPDRPELYDLQSDPGETRNIAPDHPVIVKQLQTHVDAHLQRVQATAPSMPTPALDLDEATTRRLRALGYVD